MVDTKDYIEFEVTLETCYGPGHARALAKDLDAMKAFIINFKGVCDDTYPEYAITRVQIFPNKPED